jgi:hypothetical protein
MRWFDSLQQTTTTGVVHRLDKRHKRVRLREGYAACNDLWRLALLGSRLARCGLRMATGRFRFGYPRVLGLAGSGSGMIFHPRFSGSGLVSGLVFHPWISNE